MTLVGTVRWTFLVLAVAATTVTVLLLLWSMRGRSSSSAQTRSDRRRPSGFSLGQLDYSSGVAALNFHSNSDASRHYSIIQKRSTWDDAGLRENYVKPADKEFQTVDASGLTIYLYGKQNATWMKGDIWYRVQSDGSLGNSQLVDIATSL